MREIEIKAQVQDLESLIDKIKYAGYEISEPISQRDEVFTRGEAAGMKNSVFLRIRQQTIVGRTKSVFTLKKVVDGHGDKIECETGVTDGSEMRRAIRELGFAPYSLVEKNRRMAHADRIEICLDSVENLGNFVEFEKLAEEASDHDAVVDELWDFAEQFGVNRADAVNKGYDVLTREKNS